MLLKDDHIRQLYIETKINPYDAIRNEFIKNYGVETLKSLNDKELAERLFAGTDSAQRGLFSWLEHGDKGVPKGTFGYARDSATQYGILRKSQGGGFVYKYYRQRNIYELKDEEAYKYACDLRDYLAAACELLENSDFRNIDDYVDMSKKLGERFSKISNLYWSEDGEPRQSVLKYLHIISPEKISEFYSPNTYQRIVAETIGVKDFYKYSNKLIRSGLITLRTKEIVGDDVDSVKFAAALNSVCYKPMKEKKAESSNKPEISDGNEVLNKSEFALNTILYGPPGTGKTYNTVIRAIAVIEGKDSVKNVDYSELKERFDEYVENDRIAFTTFHQSYGYEEFIEGISPKLAKDDEPCDLVYYLKKGAFKKFCDEADNDGNYVFIIDEINRGNVPKIFGELITLIEPSKRLGNAEETRCLLPYSKEPFGVPNNVYILGTMNTADRSLVQLDVALRRRFVFEEMMPDYKLLKRGGQDLIVKGINIREMLQTINERICVLLDREHQIGHSYFMKLDGNSEFEDIRNIFRRNIIPLLQEYFYDDYNSIKSILGAGFVSESSVKIGGETKTHIELDASEVPSNYIKIYDGSAGDGLEQDR